MNRYQSDYLELIKKEIEEGYKNSEICVSKKGKVFNFIHLQKYFYGIYVPIPEIVQTKYYLSKESNLGHIFDNICYSKFYNTINFLKIIYRSFNYDDNKDEYEYVVKIHDFIESVRRIREKYKGRNTIDSEIPHIIETMITGCIRCDNLFNPTSEEYLNIFNSPEIKKRTKDYCIEHLKVNHNDNRSNENKLNRAYFNLYNNRNKDTLNKFDLMVKWSKETKEQQQLSYDTRIELKENHCISNYDELFDRIRLIIKNNPHLGNFLDLTISPYDNINNIFLKPLITNGIDIDSDFTLTVDLCLYMVYRKGMFKMINKARTKNFNTSGEYSPLPKERSEWIEHNEWLNANLTPNSTH